MFAQFIAFVLYVRSVERLMLSFHGRRLVIPTTFPVVFIPFSTVLQ